MTGAAKPGVAVSAGFNKTHVTTAAREVADRNQLAVVITGAYPTARLTRLARITGLAEHGRAARLIERGEQLPAERLAPLLGPELLYDAARLFGRVPHMTTLSRRLCAATWRLYGWRAARALERATSGPVIFHFRAGYGHASIDRARQLGMHVLCDHAIAHPLVLESLIATRGRSLGAALEGAGCLAGALSDPLDRAILKDIDRSDSIVVNSEFVKETFVACGRPADRVHVIYLGVDENFLRAVPNASRRPTAGPLRLLFAGRLERRKGADVLVEALRELDDVPWELWIAGPVLGDVRAEHAEFLRDRRVRVLGPLGRAELARRMLAAPVFVFPSYAEGSARVVFEALACGCYVITTPNSGTIVEDGMHGALVPPGDPHAVASAIAAANADRERVVEIGNRNAALIRERYRQRQYGDELAALYVELRDSRSVASTVPPIGAPS